MSTPSKKPSFKVSLHEWDKISSIARVEINSHESQLLVNVLEAVKSHWGKRRMDEALVKLSSGL